ncbi:MAG: helix-turn-helix transcriptional regulator [Methylocella sp.]
MTHSLKTSKFDENEREFLGLTLARQIFGALYLAVQFRKASQGLSRVDFGDRTGRDKTGVSKLLSGPGNWTTRTISDVANALELDVQITFVDRYNPYRAFTPTGINYLPVNVAAQGYMNSMGGANSGMMVEEWHRNSTNIPKLASPQVSLPLAAPSVQNAGTISQMVA